MYGHYKSIEAGNNPRLQQDDLDKCKQPPVRDMVAFSWRSFLTTFDHFSRRTFDSLCN